MILLQHQLEAIEKFKQFYVNSSSSSSSASSSTKRRQRTTEAQIQHARSGFFIFHELGLGKTATSIRCAFEAARISLEEHPKSTFRVAIFCPASLTEQWANEIEKSFPTKEEQEKTARFVANAEIIDFGQIVKESWKSAVKRMKQDEKMNAMSFDAFVGTMSRKADTTVEQGEEDNDEFAEVDDVQDDFFLPIDTVEECENDFSLDQQCLEDIDSHDNEQKDNQWKRKFHKRLQKEISKLFSQFVAVDENHESTRFIKFLICPFSRIRSFYDIVKRSDPAVSLNMEIIDEVQTLCYRDSNSNEMKMNSTVSELLNNNNAKLSSSCRILISGYPIQNNLGELFTMFKLAFPDIFPSDKGSNSASISKILRSRFFSCSSSFFHFDKIIRNPLEKVLLSSNGKIPDAETELRAVRAMTLLCLMLRDCSHFCSSLSNSSIPQNQCLPQVRTRTILCAQTVLQKKLSEQIVDLCFSNSVDDAKKGKPKQESESDLIAFDSTKNKSEKQIMKMFEMNENAPKSSSSAPPPLLCANWLCQIAVDPAALPSHLLKKLSSEVCGNENQNNNNNNNQIPTKLDTAITLIHQLLSKSDDQNSERIVVFSHSVAVLELLSSRLSQKFNLKPNKDFFVLSGKQTPQRRHLILSEYFSSPTRNQSEEKESDDECFNFSNSWGHNRLLLASIRACGVGYNYLESATTAIMLDSRWNPAHEKQAEGRICRLTSSLLSSSQQQTNNKFKTIFRLITKDSVDEIFEEIQSGKRKLFKTVFAAGEKFCKKIIIAAAAAAEEKDARHAVKSLENLMPSDETDNDDDAENSNNSVLKDCLTNLKNNHKKSLTLVMKKTSNDDNDVGANRKSVDESIVSWLFGEDEGHKAACQNLGNEIQVKNAARNGYKRDGRKDLKPQFSRFAPCEPQQWMTCRGSGMSVKLDHKK